MLNLTSIGFVAMYPIEVGQKSIELFRTSALFRRFLSSLGRHLC